MLLCHERNRSKPSSWFVIYTFIYIYIYIYIFIFIYIYIFIFMYDAHTYIGTCMHADGDVCSRGILVHVYN